MGNLTLERECITCCQPDTHKCHRAFLLRSGRRTLGRRSIPPAHRMGPSYNISDSKDDANSEDFETSAQEAEA